MCSANKTKDAAEKDTRPHKPATATATVDAQGNLPTAPSPESVMVLAYQAELEELRRIIASQKKKLDDAQQPSTPTTRESPQSEPRTGITLSALLIVGRRKNTASPQCDALPSPFSPSLPSPQRRRQPLTPRLVALNGAIVDEALRDRADPSSSPKSSQNQSEKPPKHTRADIWQKELGFETRREYLDFRVHLHYLRADS